MAIGYTDDIKTVTDALQVIIKAEWAQIPVVINPVLQTEKLTKNEYLRIWITEDRLVQRVAKGVIREYEIEMMWYFNKTRYRVEKLLDDVITPRMERLERLLDNNVTYGTGATWYGLEVQSIEYVEDLTEELDIEGVENITAGRMTVLIYRGSFF